MGQPYIEHLSNQEWVNWHNTRGVDGIIQLLFKPYNRYEDNSPPSNPFSAGMDGLKVIVNQAKNEEKRVRVKGARWSLNNIAYSQEYMIDSSELNEVQIGLDTAHVHASYQPIANQLAFVQCGVGVKALNQALKEANLALPTTGASDGQIFAGAVATGTHGAAHTFGSMQDYVKGIHLVTLSNELVFIQRASDPVITTEYCQWLGNTILVEDDDLFNAALISFGSYGIVHGLLIETEPLYLLSKFVKRYPFDEKVREAMATLSPESMAALGLPRGTEVPYHFEVVLNPYYEHEASIVAPAFVRVFYKDAIPEDKNLDDIDTSAGNNDIITSTMRGTINIDTKQLLAVALQGVLLWDMPDTGNDLEPKFPGDQFKGDGNPQMPLPYRGTSVEIGIPLDRVNDVIDLLMDTVNKHAFAAPLAFRYVKNSKATLAFTQYETVSVSIELPGWDDPLRAAQLGHKAIFNALKNSTIPHSFHWGQAFPNNTEWVDNSYGSSDVNLWKNKRLELLGELGCRIFSNDLIESIGLQSAVLTTS